MAETNGLDNSINSVAEDLAKVVYHNQLQALDNTLERFHTLKTRYSILDEKDEAFCLIYKDGDWMTFTSERGGKTSLMIYDNIEDACKKMMYYMSESKEEYEQMIYYFDNLMDESAKERFTSKDLFNAIKNGMAKLAGSAAAL